MTIHRIIHLIVVVLIVALIVQISASQWLMSAITLTALLCSLWLNFQFTQRICKPLSEAIGSPETDCETLLSSLITDYDIVLHPKHRFQNESTKAHKELRSHLIRKMSDLEHHSQHIRAINTQHTFDGESVRAAFTQSESAADYALQVFENIFNGINTIGKVYGDMNAQSESLTVSVNEAVQKAEQTSVRVDQLVAQADEISSVANTVADIASMTQLLALNASIEAARAGESGRGFAVVADEVKKLAQQTDDATQRIASISDSISQASNESSTSIADISSSISGVQNSIHTIVGQVDSQWKEVQSLVSQMGQTAGSVSGLKGILQASSAELESHFAMLEGLYSFSEHAASSMTEIADEVGINLRSQHIPEENVDEADGPSEHDIIPQEQVA